MKLWELIRNFELKNGRMPFGRELENLKKMSSDLEFREKLIRIPEKNFHHSMKLDLQQVQKQKLNNFQKRE
jgi:hypothetical protein